VRFVLIRGQFIIPRLDWKKNGNFLTVAAMAVLLDPEYLEGPSMGAVAPLRGNSKLIDVNELALGDLGDFKRRGLIPESVHTKLDLHIHCLIGLNGGLLFGELKVKKMLEMCWLEYRAPPSL
jgi:hypothetical protein